MLKYGYGMIAGSVYGLPILRCREPRDARTQWDTRYYMNV